MTNELEKLFKTYHKTDDFSLKEELISQITQAIQRETILGIIEAIKKEKSIHHQEYEDWKGGEAKRVLMIGRRDAFFDTEEAIKNFAKDKGINI